MKPCKVLCLCSLLILSLAAAADQVRPSDRVETRLRIRAAPDGDATIIDFLFPGETLELKGSVPSWHEVVLPDGESGFVSKAWSTVVPDAGPIVVTTASQLRLGAWNIRKLGHGESKNFDHLVEVITTHFDIVAVVEVMQKAGGHPGYDELIATLGAEWKGVVTSEPRPNTSSGSAEFYAVVFRGSSIRLCDGWSGLRFANDTDDDFSREPAFACFASVVPGGGAAFDFLLAAYHARFAEGDIGEIKDEVEHLDLVFQAMQAAQPGEKDLLIAGDFNLVSSDLADTVGRPIQTVGSGSTLNGSGEVTANLYDHLVVFDAIATSEFVDPEVVIDVRSVASSNEVFFKTVSDHLPIVARFRIMGDDD